jgi:hypothetical protein
MFGLLQVSLPHKKISMTWQVFDLASETVILVSGVALRAMPNRGNGHFEVFSFVFLIHSVSRTVQLLGYVFLVLLKSSDRLQFMSFLVSFRLGLLCFFQLGTFYAVIRFSFFFNC